MKRNKTQMEMEKRKFQIEQKLEEARKLKKATLDYSIKLEAAYQSGKMSFPAYQQAKNTFLQGNSMEDWLQYYDEVIQFYEKEIDRGRLNAPASTRNYRFASLVFVLFVGMLLIAYTAYTNFAPTGYTIANISEMTQNASIEPVANDTPVENAGSFNNESAAVNDSIRVVPSMPEENSNAENESLAVAPEGNMSLVNENVSSANIVSEETIQYEAVIGKPVLWKKIISLDTEASNVSIALPQGAQNVHVKEIVNGAEQEVTSSMNSISGNVIANSPQNPGGNIWHWFIGLFSPSTITGYAIADVPAERNISLLIDTAVKDVVVEYYTEAPQTYEENTPSGKLVTVSSSMHYKKVLTYTSIPDSALQNIKLYWIVNGTKQDFAFEGYDSNNDGLVDYIEWVTPHLSNETFEISLNIITVHSYPYVQGNWTVDFNTTGTADLTITPFNGTQWSDSSSAYDLQFLEVRCGETILPYVWTNNSVFIANYSCAGIGTEVSHVITAGAHNLAFSFGSITDYAYNTAGDFTTCPSANGNVTVSSNTVWSNVSFTCDYIDITSNAILTLNSTAAGNTTINITATQINITSGSQISLGSTGYLANQGPGAAKNSTVASDGGGGHGALGGDGSAADSPGGSIYDNLLYPLQMGSGGENNNVRGPSGGAGAVHFNISGSLIVNGIINASAGKSATSGGGAGGAILINTSTLTGSGAITADGGIAVQTSDGGGAGGMIAIYYTSNTFTGKINASGGLGASTSKIKSGGAGTIYTKANTQSYGELLIENQNTSSPSYTIFNSTISFPATLDNFTIANGSNVVLNSTVTVNNTNFVLDAGSSFFQRGRIIFPRVQTVDIAGNVLFTNDYYFNQSSVWNFFSGANISTEFTANVSTEAPYQVNLSVRNLTIASGATVLLGDAGYGRNQGNGSVVGSGSSNPGAGHGGLGGDANSGLTGGTVYDNVLSPRLPGSGGDMGSNGGGVAYFNVSDTFTFNGIINASSSKSTAAGGGSGGSVSINASNFTGSGTILVNGGAAAASADGGGAGGMIAIHSGTNAFTGIVQAEGGSGAGTNLHGGSAGTVYIKAWAQKYGELTYENANSTGTEYTILNSTIFSGSILDNFTIANGSNVIIDVPLTINNTNFVLDSASELYPHNDFWALHTTNISIYGSLQFVDNYSFSPSATMTLYSGANLSHAPNSNATGVTAVYIINFSLQNLTIVSGAKIDTVQGGYSSKNGPGGVSTSSGAANPGAAYGGIGGGLSSTPIVKHTYGNLTAPLSPGSGGDGGTIVSSGAGVIFLNISDTLSLNGIINSSASMVASLGGGSGGSVYIIAKNMSGNGTISARGGATKGTTNDGGGGGGRIALYYQTRDFTGEVNVSGGSEASGTSALPSGAGSLFICQMTGNVSCMSANGATVKLASGGMTLMTSYNINESISINKTINATWMTSSSVNWTDQSGNLSVIATHNLTGFTASANYSIFENTTLNSTQVTNASGAFTAFNTSLSSAQHDINIRFNSGGGSVGLIVDDGAIAFGSGYYNASCTQGYSYLNSNTSNNCWINTTAFPGAEDVHLISNNGSAAANVTAYVQVNDAEQIFCGSAQGCAFTANALVNILTANSHAGACSILHATSILATFNANGTAALCDSLGYAAGAQQIKTWIELQVPKDTSPGAKSITVVYQAIAP
ncbi:hypothetical protein HZA98_01305 [Candidatus Woesearchaeota archaeon]|nr:hypothetical protein [Candidatus Woesearchaeota archaeon]